MTEEQEIMIYGTIMYRIDENGNRHHVPREQWDIYYNPEDPVKEKPHLPVGHSLRSMRKT